MIDYEYKLYCGRTCIDKFTISHKACCDESCLSTSKAKVDIRNRAAFFDKVLRIEMDVDTILSCFTCICMHMYKCIYMHIRLCICTYVYVFVSPLRNQIEYQPKVWKCFRRVSNHSWWGYVAQKGLEDWKVKMVRLSAVAVSGKMRILDDLVSVSNG